MGANKVQKALTPRGQLHLETVYGSILQYNTTEVKVGSSFNEEFIKMVANKKIREALLKRLSEFDNDPKKAFTGKNSLDKNPLFVDSLQLNKVPEKVKITEQVNLYTIRKPINPDLKIEKVIDKKIKGILEKRLIDCGIDPKKAFSNLEENPLWLNQEKGIKIKSVTITGVSNAIALHDKKDKSGNLIVNEKGQTQPADFVNTGNNHHVAVYRDSEGNLQENVVSFFEALGRLNGGLPIINSEYKKEEGWQFLFTLKQNEYFVFPNEKTGFNPKEIDLLDENNYSIISPNLYRVQKFGSLLSGFWFRHHLETKIDVVKELKGDTFKVIQSANNLNNIVKIRLNHLGKIIQVGEY